MPVLPKHKVGRNEPCPCGSELKYKNCHGDILKQEVCNRVANEKMVQLIRQEQRKKIITLQQKDCDTCDGKGKIDGLKCLKCQFLADDERYAEIYNRKSKEKNDETESDISIEYP